MTLHVDATLRPDDDARALARRVLDCLDLTSLNDDDGPADIALLAQRAVRARPAALCVWPRFVAQARAAAPADVRVAAVVNFPDGGLDLRRVERELRQCLAAGADEIDLVLPWRPLAEGRTAEAAALVRRVRATAWDRTLKLIVESGAIGSRVALAAACRLGLDAGVDFLKTSTGKVPVGATPDAARAMLTAIATHPNGAHVGFKASGGIRTLDDARVYVALVRELLGDAAVTPQRLRFGASGLLADLERVLDAPGDGLTMEATY